MKVATVVGLATLAVAGLGLCRPAHACGGTFCDSGPNAMPVAQTGENILFVLGETWTEAHIQIAYDPQAAAETFAWVVPVMNEPELTVGSQTLFDALASATAPTYGWNTYFEPCNDGVGDDDFDECDGDGGAGGDDGGEKLDLGAGPPSEPEVVQHAIVGAFEMFVLDGGTPDGVMTWLGDNGFAQDPAAEPILADYLAEDFMFVAFRLAPNAGASEIHPVTLRFAGTEACVPIRLTQIAASEDMEIRTWFLADHRVAPTNYEHVELNPVKIDHLQFAANYREVVSMAVDEAGGHAFVTEFAGDSSIVPPEAIVEAQWQPGDLIGMSAFEAIVYAREQGWVDCSNAGECAWASPLLEGLFIESLALPEGLDPGEIWECPECFVDVLAASAWSSIDFADALQARIVEPAVHAQRLLETWPTLTRMYTTLSPREMTVDPLFHENPDLPDVQHGSELGTSNFFCDGASSFNLPDGRLLATVGGTWPDIEPTLMPWADRIEQIPSAGAPQVVVDNRAAIDELVDRFNELHGARSQASFACGDQSDGASGLLDFDPTIGAEPRDGVGACTCTSGGGEVPVGLGLLVLVGLRRRRLTRGA